jgi:hypothetical protein
MMITSQSFRHKCDWNGKVRRLKQRWPILFVFFLFIIGWPVRLLADGTYYVGRDDGGAYFQTDQDGGWYIDREELRYFKIGQTGTGAFSISRHSPKNQDCLKMQAFSVLPIFQLYRMRVA